MKKPAYLALYLQGEGTIPERKVILEAKQKALLEEKKRIDSSKPGTLV